MQFSKFSLRSSLKYSTSAFTLIEVIVAITILGLILTSVFQIYVNIATMSKRLELARGLQNNVRSITESIARDVREGGIAFDCYDSVSTEPGCDGGITSNYSNSGADMLVLKGNSITCGMASACYIQYFLAKNDSSGLERKCDLVDITGWNGKPETACYLAKRFYGDIGGGTTGQIGDIVRLSDAATRIDSLRFYISGSDATRIGTAKNEGKVAISFRVSLAPYKGLDSELAKQMVIPVQTTISQKLFTVQ